MRSRPVLTVALVLIALTSVGLAYYSWHATGLPGSGRGGSTAEASQRNSPAGGEMLGQFNTEDMTIQRREIQAGGPPKDGIPSLADPEVVKADEADFMRADDRVVAVNIGDTVRAYPLRILNWHEAVNDELEDTPFTVVYCPLCDSVSVLDRRIRDETGEVKVLEFGISGLLHNSNVLLYDRTDEALWSQVKFEAVSGPHAGKSLEHLPWTMTTFETYRDEYPEGTVMTFDTGYRRDYSRNPYEAYFQEDRLMFPVSREDPRLNRKDRVVGIRIGDKVRAYPVERVAEAEDGRITDTLGEHRIVLEADAGADTVRLVEVPEQAQTMHTFWFAWAAYHADTEIYGEQDEAESPAEAGGAEPGS